MPRTYSINELDDLLKQFNCMKALIEISKLSRKLFNENKFYDDLPIVIRNITYRQTISQWGLAFLAYKLIMVTNDGKNKSLTWEDLVKAHSIFGELDEPLYHDNDRLGFLFRLSQEQFWWQEINLPALWSRYKYILGLDNFFSENFYGISGLTIDEYLMLGIAVLGFVNRIDGIPVFSINNFTTSSIPSPFRELLSNEEKMNLFLRLTSASYQTIRNESKRVNKLIIPRYEKYEFNPLFKYPIVQSDSRFSYYNSFRFIVPNIVLLLRKIAEGIYWDLRDHFATLRSQDFLTKFGEAFENYCGHILRNYFGEANVNRVRDILGTEFREQSHADWVVSDGQKFYIFECKSSLLPVIVRQTFLTTTLNRWIVRNLLKSIEQLGNTVTLLKNRGFITTQEVYKFPLLLEQLYFAEHPDFKTSTIEGLIKKKNLDLNNIYFMTISELEKMEEAVKKYSFTRILEQKKEIDKNNNIVQGRDFIFVCYEIDDGLKLKSKFLENIFNEIISGWDVFQG